MKDPLMQWQSEDFPYDAVAEAGISPESTMRAVQDASYTLIERGGWTPHKRAAWDELRKVEGRLWVDFFLLPMPAFECKEDQIEPIADFDESLDILMGRLVFDT